MSVKAGMSVRSYSQQERQRERYITTHRVLNLLTRTIKLLSRASGPGKQGAKQKKRNTRMLGPARGERKSGEEGEEEQMSLPTRRWSESWLPLNATKIDRGRERPVAKLFSFFYLYANRLHRHVCVCICVYVYTSRSPPPPPRHP